MTSDVTLAATVLAVIILLVILCIWPGYLRVAPKDIEGYWASRDGNMYAIRPVAGRGHEFGVNWDPRKDKKGTYDIMAAPHQAHGSVRGVRGLRIGPLHGTVALGGRHIAWADGGLWTRQGLPTRGPAPRPGSALS